MDETVARTQPYLRRSAARLGAVQILFRHEKEEEAPDARTLVSDLSAQLLENLQDDDEEGFGYEPDVPFMKRLAEGAIENLDALDERIQPHLSKDWRWTRIDPVWRALLRVAAYELQHCDDIPAKVVINEYVDVAAAFAEKDEAAFINAMLDKLARELRAGEF